MIFLVFEGLAAVCANIVLFSLLAFLIAFEDPDLPLSIFQPIQFAVLEGLFVDRLSAVGKLEVCIVTLPLTVFGLLKSFPAV